MKQEEIKPGDILYNTHTKAIVKVGRIDDKGCVKYSAYGKEPFTFYIEEYPYKIGAYHADVFVPATDRQRKYIENQLSKYVYGYISESTKTSDALIMRLGQMVKENVELEQRVHQLMEDYNRVARQLRGKEKHEDKPEGTTIGQMCEMHELCDKKDSEIEILKEENRQLQQDNKRIYENLTTAEGFNEDLRKQRDEDLKIIERLNQAEIHTNFSPCPHKVCAGDQSILVGTPPCVNCPYFLRSGSDAILCAFHYDWQNEMQQEKPSDE